MNRSISWQVVIAVGAVLLAFLLNRSQSSDRAVMTLRQTGNPSASPDVTLQDVTAYASAAGLKLVPNEPAE